MFLRRRATQVEYFDRLGITDAELREEYLGLNRLNRLVRFERPFRVWIPEVFGAEACRRMEILDLGSGDGLLGRELSAWAADRGWRWNFTNLDLCPVAAAMDPDPGHVVGSVTDLPFADGTFDLAVSSTMAHHLPSEADVVRHWCEARRVVRRGVLFCDLLRSVPFLVALWALTVLTGHRRSLRHDAVLSVRRGWRPEEWRRLAAAAGLAGARVWREHGTRVLLAWTNDGGRAVPEAAGREPAYPA